MALLVEVIMDRAVHGSEFLECLHPPKPLHRPLSSSERLHGNIERHMKGVADYLRVYDGVFLKLTQDGNGTAFRDFLLSSPEMLLALGEGAGVVNHIASFWRFRFPKNKPLEVNAGELLDILQDFESGLGGDIPAIAA